MGRGAQSESVNQPPPVPRRDAIVPEGGHDPYREREHLPEPTVCPACGAAFQGGRWAWNVPSPAGAHEHLCAACRRIRDRYPAGFLSVQWPGMGLHAQDLVNMLQNEASVETREHPLNRIMSLDQNPDGVTVSTTDVHLPRRLGEALRNAYQGDLAVEYGEDETSVRVTWKRSSHT